MYSDEFNKECRNDAKFFRREIEQIDISHISVSDLDGQIRKNGILESHVKKLADDIEERGRLLVPITVDENTMTVVEGNHRFEAYKLLNERDQGKWSQIDTRLRVFSSVQERRLYQLQANDKPPSKGSSDADYVDIIVKDLHGDLCGGITWENYSDDSSNYQSLVDLYKSRWRKLSVNANKIKGFITQAVNSAPGGKLKYTMMKDEVRALSCWSGTKWKGNNARENSNGWGLLTCGQLKHIMPNLVGNAFKRKLNAGNLKIVTLANCSELQGKSPADVSDWRVDFVEKANAINNSGMLKTRLIDEIVFSPHKIEEGCAENGFFRVKRKSNGDFDSDSIPTSGW